MDLKKRFRYITVSILMTPLFILLVMVLTFLMIWFVGRDESEDLSAPRYLQPVLREILTKGDSSRRDSAGIHMVLDDQFGLVYAAPDVKEWLEEGSPMSVEDGYKKMMSQLPIAPLSISTYHYQGKPGMVIFSGVYFTRMMIFRVIGTAAGSLFLILIVVPILMAFYLMRPMMTALISLENAAREIGRGNLEVDVLKGPHTSRRHLPVVKILADAFDNMRLELKENHERQSRIMMSISHDLKTPLTLIKGYIEALKDGMAKTPDEVAEYAQVIHDRTILLEERISDLIHFARLQTTDWKARFASIPLYQFLDEAAGIFRNDTIVRKRKFDHDLNLPSEVMVRGDRKMLFQVLENLFDNSCRYTEEGDTIRLTARIENEKAVIRLEDSGPGIKEEHIPYIFDNFYRADSGRNTRGLGIGLDSAKTIVRNHGGDIDYVSSSLGGAGFRIVLPVNE